MEIPKFQSKEDLYSFLVENKNVLIAEKKSKIKKADGVTSAHSYIDKDDAVKANVPIEENTNEIKVRAVINTTNIMDSHYDVHLPKLWNKSLKENRNIMHLQEHEMKFDKIISDGQDLRAYTKYYNWSELGFDFEGKTQALVFDSVVKRDRNSYMFKQYAKGRVSNHSVGMQYVKIELAVNSKDWPEEKDIWDKYIDDVVNDDFAKEVGYFWAVTQAKVTEGSAVPLGSNIATPTLDNNMKEPLQSTQNEPSKDTQNSIKEIKNFKFV